MFKYIWNLIQSIRKVIDDNEIVPNHHMELIHELFEADKNGDEEAATAVLIKMGHYTPKEEPDYDKIPTTKGKKEKVVEVEKIDKFSEEKRRLLERKKREHHTAQLKLELLKARKKFEVNYRAYIADKSIHEQIAATATMINNLLQQKFRDKKDKVWYKTFLNAELEKLYMIRDRQIRENTDATEEYFRSERTLLLKEAR